MKNPDRKTVSRLDALPNIGKSIRKDLESIGIEKPTDLIGQDPVKLYDTLCTTTGTRHDPCILDVFMSVQSPKRSR